MRLASGITALTLLICQTRLAAASLAYVLTYDTDKVDAQHKASAGSLSPSTARIVLAQRAGVEDYHTSEGLSAHEIDAINSFGAKTVLFQSRQHEQRALLLAPLDKASAHTKLQSQSHFTIANAPSFEQSKELFADLSTQSLPQAPYDLYDEASFVTSSKTGTWIHISPDAESMHELAHKLLKQKVTVTAVLVPSEDSDATWGLYEMPRGSIMDAYGFARQASPVKRYVPKELDEEEPLSAFFSSVHASSGVIISATNSSNSSNYTQNTPFKGILPACFASQKTCTSRTRGCTGHGACTLKYTDTTGEGEDSKKECWACSCNATKSNGLTTYWAGPACQKKDISVEFWLITLFTVGLISLVGFAVGTIWSMGEEDLPSVIGAGVSGPTARK